jgi:hypothetical protein
MTTTHITTKTPDRFIDVMTDLETTDTSPNAAIAAIGAVVFDRQSGQLGSSIYIGVDINTSVNDGGIISADTFKWWMMQSAEARQSFAGTTHIHAALHQFASWLALQCSSGEEVRIWGNGADFDMVVLGQSYKRAGLPPPWKFWNVRCFRTLKAEHPTITMERAGTHHNALDDAITQAKHVLRIDQETRIELPMAPAFQPPEPGEIVPSIPEVSHNARRKMLLMIAAAYGTVIAAAIITYHIRF